MLSDVIVVVLLVASVLASMRWLLLGEKKDVTSMTGSKKKTISVIVLQLHRKGFISITV